MNDFHVLVVEDHPAIRKQLEFMLTMKGFSVTSAENGLKALELMRQSHFQIVVTDWMMPEMDGIALTRAIRENPASGYVYILLLTAKSSKDDIVTGLQAGADDFLSKPYHPAELVARLNTAKRILGLEQCLKRANEETKILSITDALTGAYNRTYLNDRLPQEVKRAQKYSRSLSLILCDIDHFKKINDEFGHLAGDEALKAFVQSILSVIRVDCDWIARYGGDEFFIVLPETCPAGGGVAAERFAGIISGTSVEIAGKPIRMSASFGVTGFDQAPPGRNIAPDAMIALADASLYRAKRERRGSVKVEAWSEQTPTPAPASV
ncbi:MAG: diguanylate cyclase [Candidatus Krumholzibacteria bacterium]|nr:diguanylate cyclase [Candidatus Krumholzibacteria bacterium]